MIHRIGILILLSAILTFTACSDPTNPSLPPEDDPPTEILPGDVPQDFRVVLDPPILVPGEAVDVQVRWSDSNLNMKSVSIAMEGARVIGDWVIEKDQVNQEYECRQVLAIPEEIISNRIFIRVEDPDRSITHIHEAEIQGGFTNPPNTPPYEIRVFAYPDRITPGQVVTLRLQGRDDQNNMADGMIVRSPDGTVFQPLPTTQWYGFNLDAHLFMYEMDFEAPPEPGSYQVIVTVEDLEGEEYAFQGEFDVEGTNQPPYFISVWIQDRVIDGKPDVLQFRVEAGDPDGDELHLPTTAWYGSIQVGRGQQTPDGTTVWHGSFIPAQAQPSSISFRVSDRNLTVDGETFDYPPDPGGLPILDQIIITDENGVSNYFNPNYPISLSAEPGIAFGFELQAHDPQGDPLVFDWFMSVDLEKWPSTSSTPEFQPTLPDHPCKVAINCRVSDSDGNFVHLDSLTILVR